MIQKEKNNIENSVEKKEQNNTNNEKENEIINYKCKGCGVFPIIGIRYRCTVCNEFDYCEKCEKEKGSSHDHPFIKYRNANIKGINEYICGHFLSFDDNIFAYEFINKENCHMSMGKIFAKKNKDSTKYYNNELKFIQSLKHPGIITFEKSFEDSQKNYILFENCTNGNLIELLNHRKKLTEFEVKYYVLEIIEILKYLKSNKIIHRNLKLDNLYISDKMEIKLCGFYYAIKLESDDKVKTRCETSLYTAPELINFKKGYSYEVDIWSLGIIIFKLLTGEFPFWSNNKNLALKFIQNGVYLFPKSSFLSKEAKDLIQKILVLDPKKRLKLEDITNHEFFKSKIPKALKKEFLFYAPSKKYYKQYFTNVEEEVAEVENNAITKIINDNQMEQTDEDLENENIQLKNLLNKENNMTKQLSNKIKSLEKKIKEKDEEGKKDKYKVSELQEKVKNIDKLIKNDSLKEELLNLMNLVNLKNKEIQELKEAFPLDMKKGDKLIAIIFTSATQEITNFAVICKNNDIFSKIENLLYDEYPLFRETDNYFLCNGNIIDKNKSLEENNIKNSSIIMLNVIEDDENI